MKILVLNCFSLNYGFLLNIRNYIINYPTFKQQFEYEVFAKFWGRTNKKRSIDALIERGILRKGIDYLRRLKSSSIMEI